MKLKDLYLQPKGKRNGGSGERKEGRMRVSKHTFAAALFCISSIFGSLHTDAQSVSRVSKIVAGGSAAGNQLYKINQGDYSLVGGAPLNATLVPAATIDGFISIATDPTSAFHYALLDVGGDVVLATLNLQTGQCSAIATLADNFRTIAFNANGTLFGITGETAGVPETMYRINKDDGTLSIFRTLGAGSDDEVLAYNSENHYFYHWSGVDPNIAWERFDTTALDGIETLTFTPTTFGAVGALYDTTDSFIVSNTNNEWLLWDMMGLTSTPVYTFGEQVRGLVTQERSSSINALSSTAICPGSSVTLEVFGGTGGYQWYHNGSLLIGQTAATVAATVPGIYNSVYADLNGVLDSPTTGITVTYLEAPSISVSSNTEVCFGTTVANLSFSTASMYTSSGTYNYTVPAGVTGVTFDISGASGGADTSLASVPGRGGRLTGVLTVAPGDVLTITNGSMGMSGSVFNTGGFNGGGGGVNYGGGGGGATDIRINGTTLTDRVAVAGGGGGAGYDVAASNSVFGGDGDGPAAANGGMNGTGSMAIGGDQVTGGAGATYTGFIPGGAGTSGTGGFGSVDGVSGGGGAGYFGGGGGAWSGGGGGSSYGDAGLVTTPVFTAGYNNGDGTTNIAYSVPGSYSYSITWDPAAITDGFTDVSATAFPSGPSFPITVPATATVNVYTGTLSIDNGICTSNYPFSLEVKMIPTVNATPDQAGVCNGGSTTDVIFTGSTPTPTYNWTNNTTSIGLADMGMGDITSFTAMNLGTDIDTAEIIVTPELNGCFGTPDTFNYVVFPTPVLSVNNIHVCDNVPVSYTATSATAGATFSWERTSVPTGLTGPAPTASGTGAISETFDNTTNDVIAVTYTYTITANGCTNVEDLTVNINPTPVLFPTPLTGGICDGDAFSFTHNSLTAGVVFSWSRAAITGISNPASSGVGNINEVLNNTTTGTILVTYVDTLNINGCINTQTVDVNVNPTPTLSSLTTLPSICNNVLLNYTATTAVANTSMTWTRAAVTGISNAPASGTTTISETLVNTTEDRIPVTYVFSLTTTNGCDNTQNVMVTVNPTPVLNTTLTPAAICDSTVFNYEPGSNTPGATFTWTRATVTGISTAPGFGTGNPNERLKSTVSFPVAVTYVFTTTIDGCTNTENVIVTVNPRPILSNTQLTFELCDSSLFAFNPSSMTLGTTYEWQRPYVAGIGALPENNGVGNVNEWLKNNTSTNLNVNYIYTLTFSGCSRTQNIRVTVHPKPELSSHLVDSACSGVPFNYHAIDNVDPATTLTWTRANVNGITPATGSGSGDINETLVNATNSIISVNYLYTVTIASSNPTCSKTYNLNVKVRPAAEPPSIAVRANNNVCSGSMYLNYGAATPAAAGNTYIWSASDNAEIYATGAGKQYALVHFKTAGTAVITLTSSIGATGCQGVARDTVTVGTDSLAMPRVIYTNGMFVCLLNKEVVKSYQWGYDDSASLDSTMLAGEINQNYVNKTPSATRYYWVMVNDGDCIKKAYYRAPGDNTPRPGFETNANLTEMRVFPNPASDNVSVEVTTQMEGAMNVEVSNMLGQVVNRAEADARKVGFNVAALPAGMYLIDCYIGGMKVGTAKFVKN